MKVCISSNYYCAVFQQHDKSTKRIEGKKFPHNSETILRKILLKKGYLKLSSVRKH